MLLVTGGTGFIGRHVLEQLCASGVDVRCFTRSKSAASGLPSGVEVCYGDLLRGEGLDEALRGVDAVIHLAGVTKALQPKEYYLGNAGATQTLVRALEGREIRLVHVSSLAAIGPATQGEPVDEDAEPHPVAYYGKSKLEAEKIVLRHKPDAVIVRPPVVYGPRDTDVFAMLKSVARGWALEIGGGERWFSAIFVSDLAEELIHIARNRIGSGRAYFLAHAKPNSWSGLARAAGRIMGVTPRMIRIPAPLAYGVGYAAEMWSQLTRKAGIVSRDKIREALCDAWTCSTRRATLELGFEAHTTLESGLAQTLAWYKDAGWLKY